MTHPLASRMAALRRRARTVLVVYGAASAAALAIAVVLLATLSDFLFRYEETGLRLLSTAAVLGAFGWAVYRYLMPVVQARLSDVFLAQQVERKYPQLRESLSGAVAFLSADEDDASSGSPELRRTVIRDTTEEVAPLPLKDVVRLKPMVKPLLLATAVGVAAIVIFLLDRPSATIALRRLANPLGADAWPQVNHLKFVNPMRRLAAGSRYRAEVVDAAGAEITGDVKFEMRTSPDAPVQSTVMRLEGGAWVIEQGPVAADFAYRAVGGDDRSMPWIEMQVVDPAAVREISWTFRYPDYTHWRMFESGPRPLDSLSQLTSVPAGTIVEFRGRTNKPLREARLSVDAQTLSGTLDEDRQGFAFTADGNSAWRATRSASFKFELFGDDGFRGGNETRYELVVEADPPPWVKLERPTGTPEDPRGDLFVTPAAEIDVRVSTGDAFTIRPDVALQKVVLRYSRSDRSSEGDQTVPLYAGPETFDPPIADAPAHFHEEEVRTFDHAWKLKPLELAPGTFVNLFAASTDYAGQERQSEPRRLRIVSSDEFLERFNDRQRALHAELNKLRDRQNEAVEKTAEVAEATRDPEAAAEKKTRDAAAKALDLQRQVAAGLGVDRTAKRQTAEDPTTAQQSGVKGRIARMLADLEKNKIDNREVSSRLSAIAEELARLDEANSAEAAADRLADSQKENLADEAGREAAAKSLDAAKQQQDATGQALMTMLGNLAQWEDYGKFHEELSRIKQDQERLAAETLEQLQKQLAKKADPESATQKREELTGRQSALARRFDALRQQMSRAQGEENKETLGRAVEAAAEANPAGEMRAASEELGQDRVGQAPEHQQAALDKLKEVMQALSAQRADELSRLVKKLQEKEKELAALREAQKGLQKKFRDAAKMTDEAEKKKELERLGREQREQQRRAEQMAEQLRRLKAERSANRAAKSSSKMGQAGQGAESGDAGNAAEQAEQAEKDLEEAQQELAQQRKQAEEDLAREQAERLQDDIKAAIARQQRVLDETKQYDDKSRVAPLSRGELIGLLDLAREQEMLEAEAKTAAERFGQAPAFKSALQNAAGEMERAAQMLRERNTAAPTQRAEQTALRRYQQLAEAIKPRPKKDGEKKGSGGGESGGGGGGGGGKDTHSLAELILIKLMQEDVAARTKELDAARNRGGLTSDEQQEFTRLGDEQGKLADLLIDMMGEKEKKEDELLPEIKLEEMKSKE